MEPPDHQPGPRHASPAGETLLTVADLHVRYGRNLIITGVSREATRGDVRVILGANGAGKTTILKTIMGLLKPAGGRVEFPPGRPLQGLAPHEVARLGISLCPERRGILAQMSVRENLEMGAFFKNDRSRTRKNLAIAFERFPILARRQHQLAGSLSGGEQQMLAISRSLMGDPELVLMDEPSLGLAPLVTAEIFEAIRQVSRTGVTILLVEQNARQALKIANWAYVLETGVVSAQGPTERLLHDDAIRKAYLGG